MNTVKIPITENDRDRFKRIISSFKSVTYPKEIPEKPESIEVISELEPGNEEVIDNLHI